MRLSACAKDLDQLDGRLCRSGRKSAAALFPMKRKDQLDFIARIAPAAQMGAAQTGVPASVTIAQAILESAWGESKLAKEANNFFGIKARRADDYAEFQTKEFRNGLPAKEMARFRKFRTEAQCFTAHASLLSQSGRYRPAIADADDPFIFAARLYECGYSTDPSYPKELASLITEFHLRDYDVKRSAVKKA
jgi:flagellum-specific peptidoglycan hydrolase FlgJ